MMRPESLSKAIFAHRGASAYAPENTLAAFRSAQQSQADGIEFDIHLSKDHHIIVIHDEDVSRTTNGRGKVQDLMLEEIRRLDAGQGEIVPTLPQVLDLLGDKMMLNIELKGFTGTASLLPEKVTELVHDRQINRNVIYSSFNPLLLMRTRRLAPDAKCGLLLLSGALGTVVRLIFSPFVQPWSLHPDFSSVSAQYVQRAQQKGQAVITYTVNQPEDMRQMFSLGIHGLITDDPVQAREVREEK